MACPPTEKLDQMYDFSHILDFCSQITSLSIEGSYQSLGTSNIVPNDLKFDLIPFKSLMDLKILGVPMACIQSVGKWNTYYLKISYTILHPFILLNTICLKNVKVIYFLYNLFQFQAVYEHRFVLYQC